MNDERRAKGNIKPKKAVVRISEINNMQARRDFWLQMKQILLLSF